MITDREPHYLGIDSYEDVTSQLKTAAEQLGHGQLALNPWFKLADALDAFEFGHPRMDNGTQYRPLADDLAELPAVETADDFCELSDRLMCAEMAWQNGHSPLETVFSCLYVENQLESIRSPGYTFPTKVESWMDALQAYILTTLKGMALVNELVTVRAPAAIYPEEDFFATSNDYDLLQNVALGEVTQLMEQAVKFAVTAAGAASVPELRRAGGPAWGAHERLQAKLSWLNIVRQRITKKPVHLDRALDALEVYTPEVLSAEIPQKFVATFSTHIQSRAPCACVTYKLASLPLKDAVELWRRIIHGIRNLAPIYNIERSGDMLGFFHKFAMEELPAVVRAMLKSVVGERELLSQSGKLWVGRDISEISMPHLDIKSVPKGVDTFLGQAALCYLDVLTVFCQNRCRIREGLATCIVSFDSLQVSAEQADQLIIAAGQGGKVRSPTGADLWALEFSSWVYMRKLQLMLWVLLMSFEMDVLQPGEYAYTYWYGVQLSQRVLDQLGRLKSYFEQNGLRSQPGSSYGYLAALELEAEMLSQLCTAQYLLWEALDKQGSVEKLRGGDDALRFRLRFVAFESVGVPPQAQLSEFQAISNNLTVGIALQGAGNALKSVRTLSSTLTSLLSPGGGEPPENEDLQLLRRSAVGLGIAVAAAVKAQGPSRVVIQHKSYHRYFPVPRVENLN